MKRVLLFLCQGFEELEAAVFTDVLGWTRMEGDYPVEVITAGFRPKLKCTWNMIVEPEMKFEDINADDYDALAIPGGFDGAGFYEDAYDVRFLELIRQFDKKGKYIASVCVGAMPIGKSGVLKNRTATTYDLSGGHRRVQLTGMGVKVLDQRIVIDKNIITSTGPATGLDVAFTLLEKLTSHEHALEMKRHMRFID
ncbi:DJ-1/PfpI family protein [Carboxylicivirga sp. A043]|uniref:DJ-1/PfpI family protein n=1 Tax=Carboxylicivirga litoralis TaxID=2816963 RepID=UPI0021CAFF90|nr:DJ-1/PfpI family protein [Carboxylicivirga sp. A043]MCU4155574.1 DJ-1/PfpI family protein [Carboxylicivirga sp. A043]